MKKKIIVIYDDKKDIKNTIGFFSLLIRVLNIPISVNMCFKKKDTVKIDTTKHPEN